MNRRLSNAYGASLSTASSLLRTGYNPDRTLLLSSSPRSGSTWLMNIVATLPGSCPIFEPLGSPDCPTQKEPRNPFPTLGANEREPELARYMADVVRGARLSRWSSSHATISQLLFSRRYVVKCVRAARMMGWIRARFPNNKAVILIRHPCAVVASIKKLPDASAWRDWFDPEWRKTGTGLSGPRSPAVASAGRDETAIAAAWTRDTLALLSDTDPSDMLLMTYEQLVRSPGDALARLFDHLGTDAPGTAYRVHRAPSLTANAGAAILRGEDPLTSWRGSLDPAIAEQVINVCRSRGVDAYDLGLEPDYGRLDTLHRDLG